MARTPTSGRGGCGSSGGRAGRGRGGCGRGASATVPRKASEVGACKELEGHIFTIGSGNKGKDGDMLRTSMEKMDTYIGTKYGDEAARSGSAARRSPQLSLHTRKPSRIGMQKELGLPRTGSNSSSEA